MIDAYMLADTVAKSGEAAKSGPIGFAVILAFCVACYFLFKSMSKHLRTVRENFPVEQRPDEPVDLVKREADPRMEQPPTAE